MAVGTVQSVLICVPVSADQVQGVDQQVCPPSGPQYFHVEAHQVYLVDPASAGYLDGLALPFDYSAAGGLFALAFTMVVGIWMVSAGAGAVLDVIRRG